MPTASSSTVSAHDQLGGHRRTWDDLVDRQTLVSPFQRSWWLEGVAPHGTTYLLVTAGDRVIGGLALREQRTAGVSRWLAPGPAVLCPDHLDLLAEPGEEDEVVAALRAWFARPGQRVVDLRGVVADSLLARAVGAPAEPADVAPFESLPGAPEGYLAGRSSNFRRSVRRAGRRLAAQGLEHRRVALEDLPAAFAAFRALQGDRAGRGPLLAELPLLERAVSRGVALGEARVDTLASPDEIVAVSITFVVAGRISLYQVARSLHADHDGAGNVLLVAVIEDAVAAGCQEVDMLRGDEAYKGSFADGKRTVGRLRAAHGGAARVLLRAEDAARRVSATRRSPGP